MSDEKVAAVQVGSPIIRKSLAPVDRKKFNSEEVQLCIKRMREVNDLMDGVGISANQVGFDMRISLMHVKQTKHRPDLAASAERVMINPEIVSLPPASKYMWEGCLSVARAGLFVPVMRHNRVKIQYFTVEGIEVVEMLDGLEAHIAQHEIDHLDGIIFLDKDLDKSRFMSSDEYIEMHRLEKEARNESN